MWQNIICRIAKFFASKFEVYNILFFIRRSKPLTLILCKESKCFCSNSVGINRSILYSTRRTYMRTYKFHNNTIFIFLEKLSRSINLLQLNFLLIYYLYEIKQHS